MPVAKHEKAAKPRVAPETLPSAHDRVPYVGMPAPETLPSAHDRIKQES